MRMGNSNLIRIFSNYFGKIWNFLSIFLLTPVYIYYLDIDSYAVIAFYTLVISIITLADAGVASAVTREFSLNNGKDYKYNILKKIEKIYWLIFLLIGIIIAINSKKIVEVYLKTNEIDGGYLSNCVVLIAIGASIQLISSIYFGALFGVGRQVTANIIQIIWTTSKSLMVIPLFIFYESSLYVFFIWQIACNIFYVIFLRYVIFKEIKPKLGMNSNITIPKEMIRYIGGMFLISMFSALNMQADKIIVSYYFSLKEFGQYWIASYLSQLCIFIGVPMAAFLFPILSKYHNDQNGIKKIFIKYTNLLYYVVFPLSVFIFLYSGEILNIWMSHLGKDIISNEMPFLVKCLSIGSLFFAMQMPFYYTLLAKAQTKYVVYQTMFQMIVGVSLLIYFSNYKGFVSLGVPWLVVNLLGLIYLIFITFKKFIQINVGKYLLICVVVPLFISILLGWGGWFVYKMIGLNFLYISVPFLIGSFFSIVAIMTFKEKSILLKIKSLLDFPKD